jgi:hypothetical protein
MDVLRATYGARAAFFFFLVAIFFCANSAYAATITWTAQTAAENNSWKSVTYGEGIFVAVSSDGTNRVMTSPDGIAWTARSAPTGTTDSTWKSVTYGDGTFVAVANAGTTKVMTSPDGVTWTAQTAAEDNPWQSVAYGNGMFVAVANSGTNRVMSSPDGVTWTPYLVKASTWKAITFGNSMFVAAADHGDEITSPDGVTWTLHTTALDNATWNGIVYGNGLFVAVAGNMYIDTSSDGTTWSSRSLPSGFSYSLNAVAYGGGSFVGINSGTVGKLITSSNGISWSTQDVVSGQGWSAIAYGDNKFVAVGASSVRVLTGGTSPAVTTQAASSVSATSVTANGTIISEGTASSTARGFVYGADTSYGATTTEAGTFGSGTFSASLSGLTCGTLYHYASYATSDFGTSYGTDTTFTTSDCAAEAEPSTTRRDGGVVVGLIGSVGPYKGIGSGYVEPRAQIIYPDGTVVYLDTPHAQESGSCSAFAFARTLRFGMAGEDVRALQKLLNCLGFAVSDAGAGSAGEESDFFGEHTRAAIIAFQEKYAADILAPIGLAKGTGVFASLSQKKIQELTR